MRNLTFSVTSRISAAMGAIFGTRKATCAARGVTFASPEMTSGESAVTTGPSTGALAAALLCALAVPHLVLAQCAAQWSPVDPTTSRLPGTNGTTNAAVAWDPDGPGPKGLHLVIAGDFTIAGGIFADDVAMFDPVSGDWTALGGTFTGPAFTAIQVRALAVMANGDLVAGGNFLSAGGATATRVARWNRATGTWVTLGSGLPANVTSLVATGDGGLVAVRDVTVSSPGTVRVERWNPATQTWTPMGATLTAPRSLGVRPGGQIILAGTSFSAWDEPTQTWTPLGTNTNLTRVFTILPGGDIVAWETASSPSANRLVRWDDSAWTPLPGYDIPATALAALPDGSILAAGRQQIAAAPEISRWDPAGGTWTRMSGVVPSDVRSFVQLAGGALYAAGATTPTNAWAEANVVRWREASGRWEALYQRPRYDMMTVRADGDLVAAGTIVLPDGSIFRGVASWDGPQGGWTPLVADVQEVSALEPTSDGGLLIGGRLASGVLTVARWNPVTGALTPLGGGVFIRTQALTVMPDGDVIASGQFTRIGDVLVNNIARWSDATQQWSAMGAGIGGEGNQVSALLPLPNGDLIAGGIFVTQNGSRSITRWDHATSQWVPMGTGLRVAPGMGTAHVFSLKRLPGGNVVVGGNFVTAGDVPANFVAQWDGATWSAMGSGIDFTFPGVYDLATLPNGDVVAAGTFRTLGGVTLNRIGRWDGTAWNPLSTGMDADVYEVAALPSGDLIARGPFITAGGVLVHGFARWGCATACDDIDFNNNAVFPEDQDVIDFFAVFAGGSCGIPNTCNDIDFNNNGVFPEDQDVIDFFNVLAGGTCP